MNENVLPATLQEAVKYFSNQQVCIDFVATLRWADGIAVCPHCAGTETYFLATRKIWKCKNKVCRKQFSVKLGTIFEDSPIGLDKWLTAIWLIANAKNGISSYEIHRAIGITQKSAWFVLHRIRIAMESGTIEKLGGDDKVVEADETWIGGNARNMHADRRARFKMKGGVRDHKTAVLGMVERKGSVRAKIIKRAIMKEVLRIVAEDVEKGSTLYTDQGSAYELAYADYVHETVNHMIEYVRDNVDINSIVNFWSLLKRTIRGTYVSVSPEHLQKYVEEQSFRYNQRKGTDRSPFIAMIESISGKRLTYAQLIGIQPSN